MFNVTSSVVFESTFTKTEINLVQLNKSGTYKIEAWGARGGGTSAAPTGAYSKSFVTFNHSTDLSVLVGERGYDGYPNDQNGRKCGGGGGGSFVAEGSKPLCVAGGGGGFAYDLSSASSFPYSYGQSGEEGGDPGTGKGAIKQGGKGSPASSGGGGGFEGNGENSGNSYGKGGFSFLNGGNRQTSGTNGNYGYGGFGGGGSNHGYCGYSGGGGGYTGGSSSYDTSRPSGGGGSFHFGSFKNEQSTSIAGYESNKPTNPGEPNGYVIITFVELVPIPTIKRFQRSYCSNGIPFSLLKHFFFLSFSECSLTK